MTDNTDRSEQMGEAVAWMYERKVGMPDPSVTLHRWLTISDMWTETPLYTRAPSSPPAQSAPRQVADTNDQDLYQIKYALDHCVQALEAIENTKPGHWWSWVINYGKEASQKLPAQAAPVSGEVVPMLLFCPECGLQHIDEPDERTPEWDNPPHRSHLCHGCGCIWRPADIPTEGVLNLATSGQADTWAPTKFASLAGPLAASASQVEVTTMLKASQWLHDNGFVWAASALRGHIRASLQAEPSNKDKRHG